MRQEGPEFLFVDGLVVGFLRRDALHSQMIHDGVIERLVADSLADLDHAGDLVSLAFADKVRDGGSEDQDLESSHTSFFIDALKKILGYYTFECFREGRADFVLLFGREYVDHTIHGFGGAGSVEGAEHQVTRAGGYQRQLNSLQI